ncbi:ABC-type branched-chain amino acid transport systems, ATPase component [Coriobacteriaceae bacterium EMTCatB1]|nr:ABC transporter ATP-binding protein [Anaerosomatales bacterium]GAV31762.1 ABC-type branched-chain amino acid transport systems, ATPase component [Coriobacteriaceae bacterium EMTCatB1]
MLLTVENLHTFYGQIEALKGIDVEVAEGEIVTLIGANGAGKSTTLKTISGQLAPREGKIVFAGEEIQGMSAHQVAAKRIVHVPEGRRIFPRMTVEENLEMGAFLRNDAEGIAADKEMVFELFPRLKERRQQKGGTLSGGEQQMLAMARGLMAKPKLLMLDEPSMGLAPVVVETIFETIERLHQEGITILLVEQNAAMALSVADRGYVLETGRIALTGTGKELLTNEQVRKTYLGEV